LVRHVDGLDRDNHGNGAGIAFDLNRLLGLCGITQDEKNGEDEYRSTDATIRIMPLHQSDAS
jgi:hypothetical protein